MESMLKQAATTGDLSQVHNISTLRWKLWHAFRNAKARASYYRACRKGHLHVIQWMHGSFNLNKEIVVYALSIVCEYGHLDILQWFCVTFELTAGDIKDYDNIAFRTACSCGQLRIAKWLQVTYNVSVHDYRNSYSLMWPLRNGHLAVAQWLHMTYGPIDAINRRTCSPVKDLVGIFQIKGAQWLYVSYKLGKLGGQTLLCWDRHTHHTWYWQPHCLAAASCVPHSVMVDVLRMIHMQT